MPLSNGCFVNMSARRIERIIDHQYRLWDFRKRQLVLAASACVLLIGALLTGYSLFLMLVMLLVRTGEIEALRFRRAGTYFQTRRVLWIGASPHDLQHRYLLDGWRP